MQEASVPALPLPRAAASPPCPNRPLIFWRRPRFSLKGIHSCSTSHRQNVSGSYMGSSKHLSAPPGVCQSCCAGDAPAEQSLGSSADPGLCSQPSPATSRAPSKIPTADGDTRRALCSQSPGLEHQVQGAGWGNLGQGDRSWCFKEQKALCKRAEIHLLFCFKMRRCWPGCGEGTQPY